MLIIKQSMYLFACEERKELFSFLNWTVNGLMRGEAEVFLKTLAGGLAAK